MPELPTPDHEPENEPDTAKELDGPARTRRTAKHAEWAADAVEGATATGAQDEPDQTDMSAVGDDGQVFGG